MRKIVLAMSITVDGYLAGPGGELDWVFRTMDSAQQQSMIRFLRGVDTVLLGRDTYLEQAAHWPSQTSELAELMNSHCKVVFSSTLTELEWNNSRLARRSPAAEIAALKREPGKDVYVSGGAALAESLSREDLIDEYRLAVHPVALGAGKRLFGVPVDLKLVHRESYETGSDHVVYRPAQ